MSFALESAFAQGSSSRAVLGKPFAPSSGHVHLEGYSEQDQAGFSSSWECGCIHADMFLRIQQVLNSHSIGSGIKLVANEQLVVKFSKSSLAFGLICVYPAELQPLKFSSECTEGEQWKQAEK